MESNNSLQGAEVPRGGSPTPTPRDWLSGVLTETGLSVSRLARMLDVEASIVRSWLDGRHEPSRSWLREVAIQLKPNDEDYVGVLCDLSEERKKLAANLHAFSQHQNLDAESLGQRLLGEGQQKGVLDTPALAAERALRMVSASTFAVRIAVDLFAGRTDSLITRDNLHRHLRFPANLAVGALLSRQGSVADDFGLRMVREVLLDDLRTTVRLGKDRPAPGLTEHHALHMLGRYGDESDREMVDFELDGSVFDHDPLARKLGYCGLMMAAQPQKDYADRFMFYLDRDQQLSDVDLAFDATHYGDLGLTGDLELTRPTGALPGLAENIARHFLESDRYGLIAEADSHRLLEILDTGGGRALNSRSAQMLHMCLENGLLPEETYSGRMLRSRLEAILEPTHSSRTRRPPRTVTARDETVRLASLATAGTHSIIQVTVQSGGIVSTGDTYNVSNSNVVGIGREVHVTGVSQASHGGSMDFARIVAELSQVRRELESGPASEEGQSALVEISGAIVAGTEEDQKGVLARLKASGRVALDAAKKVGAAVVAELILRAMEM